MAVKIRLKRLGKIRAPHYRVVVMDSRAKRDGRAIEEIGKYQPTQDPSLIVIDSERAQYWLGVGAQPTEQVAALLKITGDWQKFKGLPGTEGTLRFAEPKVDKVAIFEAAARKSLDEPKDGATTARKSRVAPKEVAGSEQAAPTVEVPAADSAGATAPVVPSAPAVPAAPSETAASSETVTTPEIAVPSAPAEPAETAESAEPDASAAEPEQA